MEIIKYIFENIQPSQFIALIIFLLVVFHGIATIIQASKKKCNCDEEDEED